MQSFRDASGRTWVVAINVATIRRVRAIAGIDLLDLKDGKVFETLATDPITLANVLYAICKPEADAANINDEQFGESLAGDAIDAATNATIEALIDFFPNQTRRNTIRRARDAMRSAEGKVLETMDQRADQMIKEAEAKMLNQLSSALPESLE